MPALDKDQPSLLSIAALRARFPCEAEIDRVLTRKMTLRAGAGYTTQSLAALVDGTAALIHTHIGNDFTISAARWLTGGASKLQMAFTLHWTPAGSTSQQTAMVLRMQPAESLVESSRRREFEVLAAVQGVVPVPPVYWNDADATYLPYPAIVYGFVPGVTKPREATSQATGMGTHMASHWREALGPQFVSCIARVHRHPLDLSALPSFDLPAPGTASIEFALNHWERVWEEDADEDIPLMRLAAGWLRRNMPACAKPVLLHGDYRMGNFDVRMAWYTCGSVNEPWASLDNFNVSWLKPVGTRAETNGWRWSGPDAEAYSKLVDEMGSLPLGDPKIQELFNQAMKIWEKDLPVIPITQAKKIIPFDIKYWKGWPTADDDYIHPPTWWQHTHAILQHLEARDCAIGNGNDDRDG